MRACPRLPGRAGSLFGIGPKSLGRLRNTGTSIAEMREYTALVKEGKGTLLQRHAQLALHRERVKAHIAELLLPVKLFDRKLKL